MEATATFTEKNDFPFPLLSDTNRDVCLVYGTCDSPDDNAAKRMTYVIGPDGAILQVYAEVNVQDHAETLLAAL